MQSGTILGGAAATGVVAERAQKLKNMVLIGIAKLMGAVNKRAPK